MKDKERPQDYGGQAVLEGVMMRSKEAMAIAVRRADGSLRIKHEPVTSIAKKHKWMDWPIIRGAVSMVMMMSLGMKVLSASADMAGLEEEEPSKFEKWLADKLGTGVDKIVMGLAVILAVALSMGLFVLLPNLPVKALRAAGWSLLSVNLLSGVLRTIILMIYLYLCGLIPDMRRIFQYHGAEHKTIHCYENGLPLTPENAQTFSTLHPRCGTSFLLITFIFSIIFYSIFDVLVMSITGYDLGSNYLMRVLTRLLLLPLVSGGSYELLKGLAHAETPLTRALRWPGMQLQRLTTRPPTDKMLEVAIASLNAVLHGLPEGERTEDGLAILPGEPDPVQPAPKRA